MPLAATLTTERIYEGFLGEHEEYRTFFHGHTFTGNPLACAAAIASLEVFEREHTLLRLQPKIAAPARRCSRPVAAMDEVAEVRGRGFMVGIDLGEHDPALRLGHRVTLAARERGAIVRPLGDTIVLMPPLAISKADLGRLVEITAASIRAAVAAAYPSERPQRLGRRAAGAAAPGPRRRVSARAALVTGASSGIGRATALLLEPRSGFNVFAGVREPKRRRRGAAPGPRRARAGAAST